MTNEEFQNLVLEKLNKIDKEVNGIKNHTASLMEFRTEVNAQLETINKRLDTTNEKIDTIIEDNKSIHGLLGEHEVAIRTLRRKPV
ncbi:hypothetical protein [Lutispora saccharofermentans]|uniref:Uncharacterized protein n=1 Tax=Lutispora saccharofermentans TaxID=3024236 RepID=A0ABT1NCF6_9FIRM|nr:hypothetical protein [Lutispora saccharofermentans]MCQ1528821.1 hypothetical protein [Lutispora saccharofermentans]